MLLNTVVTVTISSQLVSSSHLTNYQNSDTYRRPAAAQYNIDPIFVESDTFRGHDQYARSPVTVTSPSPQHYHPYQQYPYYPSLTPSTPSPPRTPVPTPFTYPYPPIPTYPTPVAPVAPLAPAVARLPGHTPAITFLDPDPLEPDQIEVRHRSFTPRPPTQEAGVSPSGNHGNNVNNEQHHTLDTQPATIISPEANNEVHN